MSNSPERIITGLDIGTTKICAIIGRMNMHGKIEVLGIGKADSFGVMRGVVANIDKTVEAIKCAVKEAEEKSGQKVTEVYVGIAGQHIKSLQHRDIITRDNPDAEIDNNDINRLIENMRKISLNPGDRIIHVLPQEFQVDHEHGIKNPVGMCGVRIEANFHIITGQIAAARNIFRCVERAGLKAMDLILEPLASSAAVLSEEELEAGVALVDIGGGTTDIAIFQDGIIRHTAVIPIGGNIVTEDIKEGCKIMKNQAEALKVRFGSALATETPSNELISIPGIKGREPKEIRMDNLARIIQARMEEILEHVFYEIKLSGYNKKLIGGIVITGGGSQVKHLVQLVEYVTGLDTRIGYPIEHLTQTKFEEIHHPMYATGVGLILKGFEANRKQEPEPVEIAVAAELEEAMKNEMHTEEIKEEKQTNKERKGWFNNLLNTTKRWFEDDDTKDFN
ncbi:MAG: cell division protein FtsA [Bacteroidetes bacterium]|nr:cell division protein FtsA [Bacteroidota bacterium]MBP8754240.1 cell division protein FtsA [Chitinophagales bacterium]MBK8488498.1 cell division protein FtsA [Bacteroidota bacterium]MBP9188700.1 cell division protein FtsA [Chitinophagales bacterium]MBP9550249.1 cell division protein FtsA [Chitinophagales bacterium]